MAYISNGYGSGTGDSTADSEENYGLSCGNGWVVAAAASSGGDNNTTNLYICPKDLMIMDPSVLDGLEPDFVITDTMPVQFWPELYHEEPHTVPNHFEPAPRRIKPVKSAPLKINHIIKQPGPMRRGNRI